MMIRGVDPNLGEFRKVITPSHSHVLTLTPPDSGHAVWLFWSSDWEFKSWYVNLQSPLRRVRQGVQLHDHVLDIVVSPDLSWTWKDTDEFEELIARGFFSVEQEVRRYELRQREWCTPLRVLGGRFAMVGRIGGRMRVGLFRRLPDDWFEVDGTEAGTS